MFSSKGSFRLLGTGEVVEPSWSPGWVCPLWVTELVTEYSSLTFLMEHD